MVHNMEENLRRDMQEVREEMSHLYARVKASEVAAMSVEPRVERTEHGQLKAESQLKDLRLLLENQEDKGRI